VAGAILESPAPPGAWDATSRAFVEVDSLSGKAVRIVYREGVMDSFEPLAGGLNTLECALLLELRSLVFCDGGLAPGSRQSGASWDIAAETFSPLVNPPLSSIPMGTLRVEPRNTFTRGGKQCLEIGINAGEVRIGNIELSASAHPGNVVLYNATDGYVETCRLQASLKRWHSRADLLYEDRFAGDPVLELSYFCRRW
jgi:hypothetical protein